MRAEPVLKADHRDFAYHMEALCVRRHDHRRVSGVGCSLRVGLVLTDTTWNLTWWNEVGGELLNLRQPDDINSYLFALLRSPSLKEYIAENDFSEPLILDNFTTQQSVIELYFGDSPSEGYIILVR